MCWVSLTLLSFLQITQEVLVNMTFRYQSVSTNYPVICRHDGMLYRDGAEQQAEKGDAPSEVRLDVSQEN